MSGMFEFSQTCAVEARHGKRVCARRLPELNVVGFYMDGNLLFSLSAKDAYAWSLAVAVLAEH